MEHPGQHGGQTGYVGRVILPLGTCDEGGDWWTNQINLSTRLTEFNEYLVEWLDKDLVFRLNGKGQWVQITNKELYQLIEG